MISPPLAELPGDPVARDHGPVIECEIASRIELDGGGAIRVRGNILPLTSMDPWSAVKVQLPGRHTVGYANRHRVSFLT